MRLCVGNAYLDSVRILRRSYIMWRIPRRSSACNKCSPRFMLERHICNRLRQVYTAAIVTRTRSSTWRLSWTYGCNGNCRLAHPYVLRT